MGMKKVLGVFGLLVAVFIYTSVANPRFLLPGNIGYILERTAMDGILALGVALVIIAGGIDLSIGSLVGLVGCLLAFLPAQGWSFPMAGVLVLAVVLGVGLSHGLLITKLRLPPFVVTLCGLLIYRGAARWITKDREQGLTAEQRAPAEEKLATSVFEMFGIEGFGIPLPFVIFLLLAVAAALFLNRTIYGRYLLAVGRNETAARYSGINTDRIVILAYVICACLTGIGGVLYAMYQPSIQPAGHGQFRELYAIAAAVLGGCSLRGGEGSILGVVLGAALIPVLYNAINVMNLPTTMEYAIIGIVILAGVIVDELVRRVAAARQRRGGA
jgi:ribose transport system permease protein